jgi:hypothetical protein
MIWDAMAEARDLEVANVTADETSVTFRISFNVTFSKSKYRKISDHAGYKGRKITSLIADLARHGLKTFFRYDDDDTAASDDRANGADALPASIVLHTGRESHG